MGEVYLKNTTSNPWTMMLPDSTVQVARKGDKVPARSGLKVRFGQGETGEFINN
jgi:hypothetical protein